MTRPQSDNLRGALFMSLSMAGFAINDAVMKAVLVDQPLFPTLFLRGLVLTALLGLLSWATGALSWRTTAADRRLIGLRTLAEMATTLCFLSALTHLPIATATAVLQTAPLAVTLAAALILAEPIGWRRALALGVGFAGMLMILRPGSDSFDPWTLVALAAVCGIVARDLLTRRFSATLPSILVALVTSAAVTALGGVGMLLQPMPDYAGRELALIALSAPFLLIGYIFAVRAMRAGEIAFVSPFRYTILLWALLLGLVFFGELPDLWAMLGAGLVVGAGVFTLWREQVLARRARRGN